MTKRPRLLLLDANAVFAAFRHGAWEGLCAKYEVVLPSTVVRVEGMFYESRETGWFSSASPRLCVIPFLMIDGAFK